MQKIIITSVIALFSLTAMAQDKKVAVLEPAGSVDAFLKEIVRDEISSIIFNADGFTALERPLIDKTLEETGFQTSGAVDDSQISETGKRMGADLVFVSNITPLGDNLYVVCKMIDVQTARIEKQKSAQTQQGSSDLIYVVQKMVKEIFGQTETSLQTSSTVEETTTPLPLYIGNKYRCVIYQDSKPVNPRIVMAGTEALQLYNKGYRRAQYAGTIPIAVGVVSLCGSAGIYAIASGEETDPVLIEDNRELKNYAKILMYVGAGSLAIGIPCRFIWGPKTIKKSVDVYNSNLTQTTNMQLDFGITGNGVGLVLRF